MGVLSQGERERARSRLRDLPDVVTLVHFRQEGLHLPFSPATSLLKELAELSDRVRLRICDYEADRPTAARFGVEFVPATVITGPRGLGIRYFGDPSMELTKFLDGMAIVSKEGAPPEPAARERLAVLTSAPHLQAFVTVG